MAGASRLALGAAGVASVQVAAALGVQILWRHTRGMWDEVAMLLYFAAFGLLLPLLAFMVGTTAGRRKRLSLFLAWPIILTNVVAAFRGARVRGCRGGCRRSCSWASRALAS